MSEPQEDLNRAVREVGDEIGRGIESLGRMARQVGNDWTRMAGPTPSARAESSPIRSIRELANLRDEGYITDEEYQAKKAELLGRI